MNQSLVASTLGQICSLVTDGTHDTPAVVDEGYPLIKAKEIVGGNIDFKGCDHITERDHLAVIARSKPEKGDTLFAHIGASLGEAAFVETDIEFSIKNIALFKPDPAIIEPRYLYYLVISPEFQALAKGAQVGAAQPFLGLGHLRRHAVRFHSDLEVQRRIATSLSAFDDLITNNKRRIELLEQSARELFREWFIRLRYPGHEHEQVVDGVPKGWERMAASRAVYVNPKTQVLKDKEIWYVPMAALPQTGMMIDNSQLERRTVHTNVKFRQHDTLFARITPCLENGKTGYVDFLEEGDVACGSTEFIVLRGREVSAAFVYCLARSEDFRQLAIKSMTGSSGRQRVQEECFDKYSVLVPPKSVGDDFDSLAGACFRQVAILRKQIENLAKARGLLLPRLMDGRLTV